jgi:hypothetical protein
LTYAILAYPRVLACIENERLQEMADNFAGEAFFGGLVDCAEYPRGRVSVHRNEHTKFEYDSEQCTDDGKSKSQNLSSG